MRKIRIYLALLLILAGCRQAPPTTVSLELQEHEAKALAKAAFHQFGKTLKAELQAALKDGGPEKAVEVCHSRAPDIAESVSEEWGFPLGRTSHKLRNPDNAPQAVVKTYLEQHGEMKASEAGMEVTEDGGDWIVIAPIETHPMCLTCHGDPTTIAPELKAALGERYPGDEATGFEAGDLRGVFWARIPKDADAALDSLPISEQSPRQIETH